MRGEANACAEDADRFRYDLHAREGKPKSQRFRNNLHGREAA
jgi:hypothetical protein